MNRKYHRLRNRSSLFSGNTRNGTYERQYVMTAINHQNTWHSKETKKDYGPCTPANGSQKLRTVTTIAYSLTFTRVLIF